MKSEIHPKYTECNVTCGCGNIFKMNSTLCKDLHVDVCNECHPFYTGKQKIVDTEGRVDRFKQRFAQFSESKQAEKQKQEAAEATKAAKKAPRKRVAKKATETNTSVEPKSDKNETPKENPAS